MARVEPRAKPLGWRPDQRPLGDFMPLTNKRTAKHGDYSMLGKAPRAHLNYGHKKIIPDRFAPGEYVE